MASAKEIRERERAIQKGHLVIITISTFNKDIKINNGLFMLSTTRHKTYQEP